MRWDLTPPQPARPLNQPHTGGRPGCWAIFAQATFAGNFLTGAGGALSMHEMVGTEVVTAVALGQFVAAILMWRPGRRSPRPIAVTVLLFGLIYLQIEWGFTDQLALHIPNALAILSGQFLLLWLIFRRGART